MPRTVVTRYILGLLPAWLCAIALAPAAPAARPEPAPEKAQGATERIRKTLDLTASADWNNLTLPNVLTTLGGEFKLNIILDKSTLQAAGVDPAEMNVDFRAKDVKLRTLLRDLLAPFNLSFGIVGESVFVSTEENIAHRQLKQRISLDVDGVPLNRVLREMSRAHGVNLVLDPRTLKTKAGEASVTLQLDDVPVEVAVRLLAEIAGLRPVRMGNVLFVTTEDRAEKLKDSDSMVPPPGAAPGATPAAAAPGAPVGAGAGGPAPANPPAVPAGTPVPKADSRFE